MIEQHRISGRAPTLVFLHEGLGSLSAWRDFPARLAAATGLGALVYSRAGYGQSSPRPLPWPVDFFHEEARALEALVDGEVILFGHSDGASIALLYAEHHPVRGMILEAPHLFVEDKCIRAIAALGDDLRLRLAKHHHDADALFAGWRGVWLNPAFHHWRIQAPLVTALAIQGEDDEYGTAAQVGPFARRLILPRCGHSPHRDQPDEVLAASVAFIRQLL
jgi:pimeloyl-ACP methyl ester carboxylesterase